MEDSQAAFGDALNLWEGSYRGKDVYILKIALEDGSVEEGTKRVKRFASGIACLRRSWIFSDAA